MEVLVNEERLHMYFETMYERQEIWYRRFVEKQEAPWTDDPILANYKFCNVYRELDRSSQWLIQNVILNPKTKLADKLFQIFVYRLYNKPEVFERIQLPTWYDYDQERFEADVEYYEQVFGSSTNSKAYCINTWISKGQTAGMANANIIIPSINLNLAKISKILHSNSSVEVLLTQLQKVAGIGKFLSHEWFIDLCYLLRYGAGETIKMKFDENSYTSAGPGAKAGVELIVQSRIKAEKFIHELAELAPDYLSNFGQFKYVRWKPSIGYYVSEKPNLTLHTQEFWLCEYTKYWKMLNKYGKQRDSFVPITDNSHFSAD